MWQLERACDVTLARCGALTRLPDLLHAFSTRLGPTGDDFDLGSHDAGEPVVRRRRRRFCEAAGFHDGRALSMRQVHGDVRRRIGPTACDGTLDGDAALAFRADAPALIPAVRWADCVPLLLADAEGRAVAAVHAGWRGVAAGIAGRTVEDLVAAGIPAARLVAALGPAIGVCCYEVGPEVVAAVARASGVAGDALTEGAPERPRLDLRRALTLQLQRAGIQAGSIHGAPWCTACSGELFFSYRRQGSRAGRQMACIGWAAGLP